MNYKDKYTDAQLAVDADFSSRIKDEIELCITKMNEAKSARVSLPHVNERGEKVIHACNLAMRSALDYWHSRLACLERFTSRDIFNKYSNSKSSIEHYRN